MQLQNLFFHKSKLIQIASVAENLERDVVSVFKTKEERDMALNKLCVLNEQVEEILDAV
mgnify:FL=1|jgi:hypothetical protein|tara:strand:+ start:623 stop:799 length:177 start_codon:yes stop_codon:yes gene_type:complete